MRRALLLGLVLCLAGSSCGHRAPAAPPPSTPSPSATDVPSPDAIPGVFEVRQKVTARSRQGGGSFEAVLQKQPGKLILLGLTPYGSRGFLLEQTASEVKFTSYLQRDLPFSPSFMLLDVHRVFGQWLGPPLLDGDRTGVVRAELVRERWRGGVLLQRTFGPAAGGLAPTTTIAYEGQGPSGLPARVVLANTRFGYTLEIETLPL